MDLEKKLNVQGVESKPVHLKPSTEHEHATALSPSGPLTPEIQLPRNVKWQFSPTATVKRPQLPVTSDCEPEQVAPLNGQPAASLRESPMQSDMASILTQVHGKSTIGSENRTNSGEPEVTSAFRPLAQMQLSNLSSQQAPHGSFHPEILDPRSCDANEINAECPHFPSELEQQGSSPRPVLHCTGVDIFEPPPPHTHLQSVDSPIAALNPVNVCTEGSFHDVEPVSRSGSSTTPVQHQPEAEAEVGLECSYSGEFFAPHDLGMYLPVPSGDRNTNTAKQLDEAKMQSSEQPLGVIHSSHSPTTSHLASTQAGVNARTRLRSTEEGFVDQPQAWPEPVRRSTDVDGRKVVPVVVATDASDGSLGNVTRWKPCVSLQEATTADLKQFSEMPVSIFFHPASSSRGWSDLSTTGSTKGSRDLKVSSSEGMEELGHEATEDTGISFPCNMEHRMGEQGLPGSGHKTLQDDESLAATHTKASHLAAAAAGLVMAGEAVLEATDTAEVALDPAATVDSVAAVVNFPAPDHGAHLGHTSVTELQQTGTELRTEGSKPHTDGSELHTEGTKLHTEGSELHTEGTKLHTEGTKLHTEGTKLHTEGTKLHTEGTKLHTYTEGPEMHMERPEQSTGAHSSGFAHSEQSTEGARTGGFVHHERHEAWPNLPEAEDIAGGVTPGDCTDKVSGVEENEEMLSEDTHNPNPEGGTGPSGQYHDQVEQRRLRLSSKDEQLLATKDQVNEVAAAAGALAHMGQHVSEAAAAAEVACHPGELVDIMCSLSNKPESNLVPLARAIAAIEHLGGSHVHGVRNRRHVFPDMHSTEQQKATTGGRAAHGVEHDLPSHLHAPAGVSESPRPILELTAGQTAEEQHQDNHPNVSEVPQAYVARLPSLADDINTEILAHRSEVIHLAASAGALAHLGRRVSEAAAAAELAHSPAALVDIVFASTNQPEDVSRDEWLAAVQMRQFAMTGRQGAETDGPVDMDHEVVHHMENHWLATSPRLASPRMTIASMDAAGATRIADDVQETETRLEGLVDIHARVSRLAASTAGLHMAGEPLVRAANMAEAALEPAHTVDFDSAIISVSDTPTPQATETSQQSDKIHQDVSDKVRHLAAAAGALAHLGRHIAEAAAAAEVAHSPAAAMDVMSASTNQDSGDVNQNGLLAAARLQWQVITFREAEESEGVPDVEHEVVRRVEHSQLAISPRLASPRITLAAMDDAGASKVVDDVQETETEVQGLLEAHARVGQLAASTAGLRLAGEPLITAANMAEAALDPSGTVDFDSAIVGVAKTKSSEGSVREATVDSAEVGGEAADSFSKKPSTSTTTSPLHSPSFPKPQPSPFTDNSSQSRPSSRSPDEPTTLTSAHITAMLDAQPSEDQQRIPLVGQRTLDQATGLPAGDLRNLGVSLADVVGAYEAERSSPHTPTGQHRDMVARAAAAAAGLVSAGNHVRRAADLAQVATTPADVVDATSAHGQVCPSPSHDVPQSHTLTPDMGFSTEASSMVDKLVDTSEPSIINVGNDEDDNAPCTDPAGTGRINSTDMSVPLVTMSPAARHGAVMHCDDAQFLIARNFSARAAASAAALHYIGLSIPTAALDAEVALSPAEAVERSSFTEEHRGPRGRKQALLTDPNPASAYWNHASWEMPETDSVVGASLATAFGTSACSSIRGSGYASSTGSLASMSDSGITSQDLSMLPTSSQNMAGAHTPVIRHRHMSSGGSQHRSSNLSGSGDLTVLPEQPQEGEVVQETSAPMQVTELVYSAPAPTHSPHGLKEAAYSVDGVQGPAPVAAGSRAEREIGPVTPPPDWLEFHQTESSSTDTRAGSGKMEQSTDTKTRQLELPTTDTKAGSGYVMAPNSPLRHLVEPQLLAQSGSDYVGQVNEAEYDDGSDVERGGGSDVELSCSSDVSRESGSDVKGAGASDVALASGWSIARIGGADVARRDQGIVGGNKGDGWEGGDAVEHMASNVARVPDSWLSNTGRPLPSSLPRVPKHRDLQRQLLRHEPSQGPSPFWCPGRANIDMQPQDNSAGVGMGSQGHYTESVLEASKDGKLSAHEASAVAGCAALGDLPGLLDAFVSWGSDMSESLASAGTSGIEWIIDQASPMPRAPGAGSGVGWLPSGSFGYEQGAGNYVPEQAAYVPEKAAPCLVAPPTAEPMVMAVEQPTVLPFAQATGAFTPQLPQSMAMAQPVESMPLARPVESMAMAQPVEEAVAQLKAPPVTTTGNLLPVVTPVVPSFADPIVPSFADPVVPSFADPATMPAAPLPPPLPSMSAEQSVVQSETLSSTPSTGLPVLPLETPQTGAPIASAELQDIQQVTRESLQGVGGLEQGLLFTSLPEAHGETVTGVMAEFMPEPALIEDNNIPSPPVVLPRPFDNETQPLLPHPFPESAPCYTEGKEEEARVASRVGLLNASEEQLFRGESMGDKLLAAFDAEADENKSWLRDNMESSASGDLDAGLGEDQAFLRKNIQGPLDELVCTIDEVQPLLGECIEDVPLDLLTSAFNEEQPLLQGSVTDSTLPAGSTLPTDSTLPAVAVVGSTPMLGLEHDTTLRNGQALRSTSVSEPGLAKGNNADQEFRGQDVTGVVAKGGLDTQELLGQDIVGTVGSEELQPISDSPTQYQAVTIDEACSSALEDLTLSDPLHHADTAVRPHEDTTVGFIDDIKSPVQTTDCQVAEPATGLTFLQEILYPDSSSYNTHHSDSQFPQAISDSFEPQNIVPRNFAAGPAAGSSQGAWPGTYSPQGAWLIDPAPDILLAPETEQPSSDCSYDFSYNSSYDPIAADAPGGSETPKSEEQQLLMDDEYRTQLPVEAVPALAALASEPIPEEESVVPLLQDDFVPISLRSRSGDASERPEQSAAAMHETAAEDTSQDLRVKGGVSGDVQNQRGTGMSGDLCFSGVHSGGAGAQRLGGDSCSIGGSVGPAGNRRDYGNGEHDSISRTEDVPRTEDAPRAFSSELESLAAYASLMEREPSFEDNECSVLSPLLCPSDGSSSHSTPENATGPIHENATGPIPENVTGSIPENASDPVSEKATDTVPDNTAGTAADESPPDFENSLEPTPPDIAPAASADYNFRFDSPVASGFSSDESSRDDPRSTEFTCPMEQVRPDFCPDVLQHTSTANGVPNGTVMTVGSVDLSFESRSGISEELTVSGSTPAAAHMHEMRESDALLDHPRIPMGVSVELMEMHDVASEATAAAATLVALGEPVSSAVELAEPAVKRELGLDMEPVDDSAYFEAAPGDTASEIDMSQVTGHIQPSHPHTHSTSRDSNEHDGKRIGGSSVVTDAADANLPAMQSAPSQVIAQEESFAELAPAGEIEYFSAAPGDPAAEIDISQITGHIQATVPPDDTTGCDFEQPEGGMLDITDTDPARASEAEPDSQVEPDSRVEPDLRVEPDSRVEPDLRVEPYSIIPDQSMQHQGHFEFVTKRIEIRTLQGLVSLASLQEEESRKLLRSEVNVEGGSGGLVSLSNLHPEHASTGPVYLQFDMPMQPSPDLPTPMEGVSARAGSLMPVPRVELDTEGAGDTELTHVPSAEMRSVEETTGSSDDHGQHSGVSTIDGVDVTLGEDATGEEGLCSKTGGCGSRAGGCKVTQAGRSTLKPLGLQSNMPGLEQGKQQGIGASYSHLTTSGQGRHCGKPKAPQNEAMQLLMQSTKHRDTSSVTDSSQKVAAGKQKEGLHYRNTSAEGLALTDQKVADRSKEHRNEEQQCDNIALQSSPPRTDESLGLDMGGASKIAGIARRVSGHAACLSDLRGSVALLPDAASVAEKCLSDAPSLQSWLSDELPEGRWCSLALLHDQAAVVAAAAAQLRAIGEPVHYAVDTAEKVFHKACFSHPLPVQDPKALAADPSYVKAPCHQSTAIACASMQAESAAAGLDADEASGSGSDAENLQAMCNRIACAGVGLSATGVDSDSGQLGETLKQFKSGLAAIRETAASADECPDTPVSSSSDGYEVWEVPETPLSEFKTQNELPEAVLMQLSKSAAL